MSDFNAFVEAMREGMPSGSRVLLCSFSGDPQADGIANWRARVLPAEDPEAFVDARHNVYLCVSAMRKNDRGEFRRRKDNFSAGLLLMIDDLGTGSGSKFPLSILDAARPSALIETSPDNFQAVYFFKEPVTDLRLFDELINSFIRAQFLGKDTGMAGVNRVFRPPIGVNGKPKYAGHKVTLTEFNPAVRYTPQALAAAFGLDLQLGPRKPATRPSTATALELSKSWEWVFQTLAAAELVKGEAHIDISGWIQLTCPWVDEHTDGKDTGAAIRLPHYENDYVGGFRCHHGACLGRGMRHLTDWAVEESGLLLDLTNAEAPLTAEGLPYALSGLRAVEGAHGPSLDLLNIRD